MSTAWVAGSTRRWRRIRAAVLAANAMPVGKGGWVHGWGLPVWHKGTYGGCRLAVPGVCTHKATCVHHTLGRAETGDDPRYLLASCQPCNLHVGNPQVRKPQPRKVTKW
jgi:hypothetical protein